MTLPPGHTHESWAEACIDRAKECAHEAAIHLLHGRDATLYRDAAGRCELAATSLCNAGRDVARTREHLATIAINA